jgi:WD40 repeat protein
LRKGSAFLIALLTLLLLGPAHAQDRAKIEIVPTLGHLASIYSVAFSSDGARVLSGSLDNTMKLWDAATGALIRTFKGHSNRVSAVAFSPDGTRTLSCGVNTIRLWDTSTGGWSALFRHSDPPVWAAFSPEGARVLSGSIDRTLKLWDATTGALIHDDGHELPTLSDDLSGLFMSTGQSGDPMRVKAPQFTGSEYRFFMASIACRRASDFERPASNSS